MTRDQANQVVQDWFASHIAGGALGRYTPGYNQLVEALPALVNAIAGETGAPEALAPENAPEDNAAKSKAGKAPVQPDPAEAGPDTPQDPGTPPSDAQQPETKED